MSGRQFIAQDYELSPGLVRRIAEKTRRTPGCWDWLGSLMGSGYPQIHVKLRSGKWSSTVAHRVSYEIHRGAIPGGLVLDHLCRNRACVNPGHLEPVTNQANILRGEGFAARHAQKTTCPQGHDYTTENTYVDKGNMRHCRTCFRDRARAKRAAA